MYAQKAIVKEIPDIPLLSSLLAGLKDHEYLNEPLVGLYFHGLMMNIDPNSNEHYQRFRDLLFSDATMKLPMNDRETLNIKMSNFCLKKYISGEQEYLIEAFKHDQYAESNGFLIAYGELSERKFKNIVALALECEETGWAKSFIDKYAPQLPEDTREVTVDLTLAELECCCGNYDIALQYLSEIKKIDDFDYVKIQTLQMRINFEKNEWNEIKQYSENIRKFFQRNTLVSEEYKNRTRQLFHIAASVAKAVVSDESNIINVLTKIEQEIQTVPCNSKRWLLGEIAKFKQKKLGIIIQKGNIPLLAA